MLAACYNCWLLKALSFLGARVLPATFLLSSEISSHFSEFPSMISHDTEMSKVKLSGTVAV